MSTNREPADRPEHLDQIRDIILGPQKKEVDTRLAMLEDRVKEMEDSLSRAIRETSDAIMRRLEEAIASLEARLAGQGSQAEADRAATRELVHELESRVMNTLQQNVLSVSKNLGALESSTKADTAKLQQDLNVSKEQLYADLDARLAELADSRVEREGLAELLMELGSTLKSGKRQAELKLVTKKQSH